MVCVNCTGAGTETRATNDVGMKQNTGPGCSQPGQARAMAGVILGVTVWGASFIATKIALREMTPVALVWSRFFIGWLVLGVVAAGRKASVPLCWKAVPQLLLLGALGVALHQWVQSTGLETSAATTGAWLVTFTPVFIALLGLAILGEKLRWLQILGILVAAAGVVIVVSHGDLASVWRGGFGHRGDFLILLSGMLWALFSVFSRKQLQVYTPAALMFLVMGAGMLEITLPMVLEHRFHELSHLTTQAWAAVSFLGVFCSGLAYVFWYDALQVLPAARVGAFLYAEPLVAAVVAYWLLGEPFLWSNYAGGAAIVAGVILVNRKKGASRTAPENAASA
jgi:drug/metabolite transporter (DMT)-like permease